MEILLKKLFSRWKLKGRLKAKVITDRMMDVIIKEDIEYPTV